MNILFEDTSIIIAEKPPNMPSVPDKTGDHDLQSEINGYLLASGKPEYSAIITRLDRGVGGLTLFALNKTAANALSNQRETIITKLYGAVVCGFPKNQSNTLTDFLLKNERTNTSKVVRKISGAKLCMLEYAVIKQLSDDSFGNLSLLDVYLKTGRHHQIRVQLSHAEIPIWGDTKYNSEFGKAGAMYKKCLSEGLQITPALWCKKLELHHPVSKEKLSFSSEPRNFPFCLFQKL